MLPVTQSEASNKQYILYLGLTPPKKNSNMNWFEVDVVHVEDLGPKKPPAAHGLGTRHLRHLDGVAGLLPAGQRLQLRP